MLPNLLIFAALVLALVESGKRGRGTSLTTVAVVLIALALLVPVLHP